MAAKVLPSQIRKFRLRHPLAKIVERDILSDTLERQFQERQIDTALIALSQILDALEFSPIVTEPFGLVCPADSALSRSTLPLLACTNIALARLARRSLAPAAQAFADRFAARTAPCI
jgi:DNA-binding transcriptional LysR family regulator